MKIHWNNFDAYLFDVDGTLIHCADAVHYLAFCDALSWVAGRPMNLDGVTAHGNTDLGILRDAFALAGIPDGEWRPRIAEVCSRMCLFVGERRHEFRIHAMPGAFETLSYLRERGALTGVATGNLETIGRYKLEAALLDGLIDFCGFSDGLECRADVFAAAARRARAMTGAGDRIVFIGDTPADIAAAHANHLPVIAVATGIYRFEELAFYEPDLCLHSLEELAVCA